MRRLFALTLLLTVAASAMAQVGLKVSLQNNHLWRGMEVADGLVVLTDATCTFAGGHLSAGLWGGTNTRGTYKELNHCLRFQTGGFQLQLSDTYNFSPGADYNNHEYFNYKARTTGRFLDCTASYRLSRRWPLQLSWATILFGRDRGAANTHQRYSTFCLVEAPVWKNDDWTVEAGVGGAFALSPAQGEKSHFYGTSAGIVHLTLALSRTLHLGSYDLPLWVRGQWNPQSQQAYLQLGAEVLRF